MTVSCHTLIYYLGTLIAVLWSAIYNMNVILTCAFSKNVASLSEWVQNIAFFSLSCVSQGNWDHKECWNLTFFGSVFFGSEWLAEVLCTNLAHYIWSSGSSTQCQLSSFSLFHLVLTGLSATSSKQTWKLCGFMSKKSASCEWVVSISEVSFVSVYST